MNGFELHMNTREPAFAGQFYPGTKTELNTELHELFREGTKNISETERLRALIAPHAGYIFSGRVAASAFNQISPATEYKKVFVLASSHRYHFKGAAVYTSGNYRTPLGDINVDISMAEKLLQSSDVFQNKPEAHDNEHSLEVQLPFLQHKLNCNFLLVPVILGTQNIKEIKKIAALLKPYFSKENLFVISTDFSHYPKFSDAEMIDSATADAICLNNPEKLLQVLNDNEQKKIPNLATSLCGWSSVLTLLYITENKKLDFQKIEYRNSGHVSVYGDKHRVVGYWAISVSEKQEEVFHLSTTEQEELLLKARFSIEHYIETGKQGNILPAKIQGSLNIPAGAFISIYIKGELRGCIGSFAKLNRTLNEVVQKNAVSASCDIRFAPLQKDELNDLEIEISVLSPMRRIASIEEIELGKHGIFIKKGTN
ncbi:MAG: AmmeMemoRadiSam system protein B, partial [Prolixibacteraceae bacterium]